APLALRLPGPVRGAEVTSRVFGKRLACLRYSRERRDTLQRLGVALRVYVIAFLQPGRESFAPCSAHVSISGLADRDDGLALLLHFRAHLGDLTRDHLEFVEALLQ